MCSLWCWEGVRLPQHLIKPQIDNWYWCRLENRALDVILTQMRLGKVGLNKYLQRINRSPTDTCTNCNSGEIEDINHYLLECQKYSNERTRLINFLNSIGIIQITINDLLGAAVSETETLQKINLEVSLYIHRTKRFKN